MRYFFDVTDNGRELADTEGSELASDDEARSEALELLGQRAKDELPDGDHRLFVVDVTDDRRNKVLSVNLFVAVTYPHARAPRH